MILVSINLTPYFGQGPVYPTQKGFESDDCRYVHWWTSILYIGNFINSNKMCLGITWYLHNDMQFHWIAPLVLIPFVLGRKSISFIIATLFVLIGIGSILGILLYYPNNYLFYSLVLLFIKIFTLHLGVVYPHNYSCYLVHSTVLHTMIYSQTMPFFYQAHLVVNNFISQIFFSYVAAIFVTIFFETPFFQLGKKLFKR
ncbi:unnamed protein product [Adineta steineri]|uniref:Acyltransferase 3 domain-containing protein n=1 Tax=Adineta steineri TaxID=433720 RepID=A0A813SZN5_9BILA|nr:unnamed protein product [Adineta steineri]